MSYELSLEEVENLSYYDFMGYLGVPFFNVGGQASMDRLAEMCHIKTETIVLEVGCGTGANACYLAEKFGCKVVGVDIAEQMIKQATRKAEERGLTDRVSFKIGDAYRLDFPDATFDSIITVFVSQFLDPSKAFPEFNRVLKNGGCLGVNEMYREESVPSDVEEKVNATEKTFRELTSLPFTLRSPEKWSQSLEDACFKDIKLEKHPNANESPYSKGVIEEFGGWGKFAATIWRTIVYALRSTKVREKYVSISSTKKTLLKDKETSKYIGYILCAGKK